MRIIAVSTIKKFYTENADSKTALEAWYKTAKAAQWQNLADIRNDFNSVDYVENKRYVFNIKGNDYQLVAKILLGQKIIYIRFIGSHSEYDKLTVKPFKSRL